MHTTTLSDDQFCYPPGSRSYLHGSLSAARAIRAAGLPVEAIAVVGLVWGAAAENPVDAERGRVHLHPLAQALDLEIPLAHDMVTKLEKIRLVEMDEWGWISALPVHRFLDSLSPSLA